MKAIKLSEDFVLPKSVQKVHVEGVSSKKLDLSNYKNLKEFSVEGSTENLQLNGCANLEKLDIEDYYLKTLNLSGCSGLTEFDTLDQDNLKNIDFTGCKGLKKLRISSGGLKKLNLQECSKLKELEVNAGKLTDLKLPEKIQKITFENLLLTSLDLSKYNKLEEVYFEGEAPKLGKR